MYLCKYIHNFLRILFRGCPHLIITSEYIALRNWSKCTQQICIIAGIIHDGQVSTHTYTVLNYYSPDSDVISPLYSIISFALTFEARERNASATYVSSIYATPHSTTRLPLLYLAVTLCWSSCNIFLSAEKVYCCKIQQFWILHILSSTSFCSIVLNFALYRTLKQEYICI